MRTQMNTLLARLGFSYSAHHVHRLRVVAVSSRERHRLAEADADDRAKIRSPESTGIPDLHRSLRAMSRLGHPLTQELDRSLRAIPDPELLEAWDAALEQEGVM